MSLKDLQKRAQGLNRGAYTTVDTTLGGAKDAGAYNEAPQYDAGSVDMQTALAYQIYSNELMSKNFADVMAAQAKATASQQASQAKKDIAPTVAELNTATLFHGENGLFTSCALDRNIISTVVTPSGIIKFLPAVGLTTTEFEVGLLTGYDPDQTPEAVYPCENAPSGTYNACIINFQWGRVMRDTKTIEFDEVIKRKNRADTSLVLMGAMLNRNGNNGRLSMGNLNVRDMLNVVVLSEMVGVGISIERVLGRMAWNGDPLNNTAFGGYKEFTGLDLQITTGITDIDGNPCPAVDSLVEDWGYFDVCGVDAGGRNISQRLSDMENYLYGRMDESGVGPATWAIAMHPTLWRELTECWPCQYLTTRCDVADDTTGRVVVMGNEQVELRNKIREGNYLAINGRIYPVWTDNGIIQQDNASTPGELDPGEKASTIYFLPLTIKQSFPVLYVNYIDYRAPEARAEIGMIAPRNMFWSDDGVFSWSIQQVKWCFTLSAKVEPQIVLRTPHIAGKLENVAYTPHLERVSPYPDDDTYLS